MTPTRFPVVIFDLDGTIVDSAPGIAAALNALGIARHPVSVEQVRGLVSFGAGRLIGETLSLPQHDIATALEKFRDHYASDPCRADDLYPGAHNALTALKASGVRLGVCTNKPQKLAETVIDRVGLAKLLPIVFGSTPHRPSKPNPHSLLDLIELLASDGRAVLVGDSMVDAEVAKAAGIPFVHVTYGYGAIDAGMACAGTVETMAALLSTLSSLLQLEHANAF